MLQENIQLVQRAYDGVNERLEPPRELFAVDYEMDGSDFGQGVHRGHAEAQEVLVPYWSTFDQFRIELEEVVHADDAHVITRVRDGGRIKESDAEVWNRFFHVWRIADGRIVRLSIHATEKRALEAAGVRE
jgi:ketosteroid isomerase-like protein